MAITLEQLTAGSDKKYRMLLLGGRTGLENSVRWVHMVEDREVPDFLHGNELVFTTGIGHIKGARLFEFVESLYKHGAAGIVVNLGPYIHDIPSHVVAYCDNAGFPIFSLPWDVHIIDITFDYCSRIIENEKIETTAASALTDIFQRGDFREEYTQALKKAGISNDKSLRVAAFCFLQRGADVTEAIYDKNRHQLWKILGLSKMT
jgi:hypothetical protein